jgi:hypothetical protein
VTGFNRAAICTTDERRPQLLPERTPDRRRVGFRAFDAATHLCSCRCSLFADSVSQHSQSLTNDPLLNSTVFHTVATIAYMTGTNKQLDHTGQKGFGRNRSRGPWGNPIVTLASFHSATALSIAYPVASRYHALSPITNLHAQTRVRLTLTRGRRSTRLAPPSRRRSSNIARLLCLAVSALARREPHPATHPTSHSFAPSQCRPTDASLTSWTVPWAACTMGSTTR